MQDKTVFNFRLSANLRFGCGESAKLKDELIALNFKKPAAIVDKAVIGHPQAQKALLAVREALFTLDIFKNDFSEPSYDDLELIKAGLAGGGYDCLIGIGGGSTLDLAKGCAVLLNNAGPALSYKGFPKLKNRPLPVIALPTTAGSASEATYNAVFTDTREKRKLGINSILNFPVCAIVDSLFTVDCPKQVTVSSGSDALVHALESFANINHTPLSRIYSKEAFRLLFGGLNKVLDAPGDIAIRSDLALGAYLAGIALMNSGSGPAGGFSYPLGVMHNVPHGYAGAVFLVPIIKMNVEKGYPDYAELYELINGSEEGLSVKEKNIKFAEKIQELLDNLGAPKRLSDYHLSKKDVESLAGQYDNLKLAIAQNPVEITREDAQRMLAALA